MNLSEALLHALKAHGAREIFGIPGDYALPFFKAIEACRRRISICACRSRRWTGR